MAIGKSDRGAVVGVADAARLLVDLPNKVRDVLGILIAVNLHEDAGVLGKQWIEIAVDAYPYPVS